MAAALIMGDLTHDSELFNHDIPRELLPRLRPPYYFVLGNHDLKRQRPAGVAYEGEAVAGRRGGRRALSRPRFPRRHDTLRRELPGGVALIVLDTNRSLAELALAGGAISAQEDGFIGEPQLAWLDGVLTQLRAAGRLPLVAVHHALLDQSPAERPGHMLYGAFRHWRIGDSAPLLECLKRHRVPLVLYVNDDGAGNFREAGDR